MVVTWAVSGLTFEAFSFDDGTEVIATGNGWDNEDEAERGALVRAGEVDLAGKVKGVVAGTGPAVNSPTWLEAGQLGLGCSARPVWVRGGGFDRSLGAVGDALQGGGKAGRGGDLQGV